LDHIQALLAFTAPTMNAYQRFKPQNWASFCRCWGPDNREATVRLASSFSHAPEQTLNLEYRVADPTCNPYLALSAVLLAGWSGITRKLEPAPAVVCNPVHLSVEDQAHYGIQLYPVTLAQALDALAKDQLLSQAIGPHLVQEYELMKRLEIKMVQSLGEHGEQHAYQFLF
jgi:glutamine synthetase